MGVLDVIGKNRKGLGKKGRWGRCVWWGWEEWIGLVVQPSFLKRKRKNKRKKREMFCGLFLSDWMPCGYVWVLYDLWHYLFFFGFHSFLCTYIYFYSNVEKALMGCITKRLVFWVLMSIITNNNYKFNLKIILFNSSWNLEIINIQLAKQKYKSTMI